MSKIKFESHTPGSFDFPLNIPLTEFDNLDHLLNHPWIKGWNEKQEGFHYCWDDNDGRWSKAVLMAEWIEKGERTWWVLGYMDQIPVDLPKWEYRKKEST